jgi:hypothetical protein
VKSRHATGNTVRPYYSNFYRIIMAIIKQHKDSTVSQSMVKTSKQFHESTLLLHGLLPVTEICNSFTKTADPKGAEEMSRLVQFLSQKKPGFAALHAISPSLHEGIAVIYNRRSGGHRDGMNCRHSWTPMCVLGWFEGGSLALDELGLTIRYQPGDFIAIKGREVMHRVEKWKGKLRISLVYYTHESLWREGGLR